MRLFIILPILLACSKLFTNETGTVSSPGFPYRTAMYTFCTYAIRLQKGARIQLAFKNFSISDNFAANYFKVYDGRNSSAPLVATMRGSRYWNVSATGNEIFLEFRSYNRYFKNPTWSGFQLNYYDNQGILIYEHSQFNITFKVMAHSFTF